MAKQITYGEKARRSLIKGVDAMVNAMKVTLGPKGRPVALDKKFGPPAVVDDGVSIAKDIELEDHFENMGAQLVKEAATKTNDACGDGTTSSSVLAQSIIHAGMKNIAAGAQSYGSQARHREGNHSSRRGVKENLHRGKGQGAGSSGSHRIFA